MLARAYFVGNSVKYGRGFRCYGQPIIRCFRGGRIELGDDVTMINSTGGNALGINGPCILYASESASITIGSGVGLSGVVLHAVRGIDIGDRVLIGANVKIFDHDFHSLDYGVRRDKPDIDGDSGAIIIEDDVFIGTGALILKRVRIGRGAVIGAGAVVSRNVPGSTVWAGNPARMVRVLK